MNERMNGVDNDCWRISGAIEAALMGREREREGGWVGTFVVAMDTHRYAATTIMMR